jgi:hypothetical protein
MFAEAARRLIIVGGVDDFADDPNPLEKRSGDRHSTVFGLGLDPKSQLGAHQHSSPRSVATTPLNRPGESGDCLV